MNNPKVPEVSNRVGGKPTLKKQLKKRSPRRVIMHRDTGKRANMIPLAYADELARATGWAVANLDSLFKSAIRTHSGPDRDRDVNISGMHRYFSPILHAGEVLLAKLTVKEFARGSEGIRIYSVEAVDVVKPAGNWVSKIPEDSQSTPQAGFEEKLQQRIDEVKPPSSPSFSLGPAQVADLMAGNALKRITDPRRRTQVMSRIARDYNAMRLQIDRMASLAGIRRSKGDLRREAAAREDLRAEELIGEIHSRFGSLLADGDLVKIKAQPVNEYLSVTQLPYCRGVSCRYLPRPHGAF